MKFEIDSQLPANFIPDWPEQYNIFSHFEFVCGIPQTIFAITTLKANGQPNVCLQSWSSFSGNDENYFVFLSGLSKQSHTYRNIIRDRAFVINFLPASYYDNLARSIQQNQDGEDELAVCGLHQEKATLSDVPRISEAFLSLECELHQTVPISGNERMSLLIGRILHAAISENYACGIDKKYDSDGFFFNIHSPVNVFTGRCDPFSIGTLKIERKL